METVYYTFYAPEEAKASGGEDRCGALVRRDAPRRYAPTANNVISLDDYRKRRAVRHVLGENGPAAGEAPAREAPVRPHPRRGEKVLAALELLACVAIIAVAGVACAVFLL